MRRFSVINCLLIFWLFLLLYIGVASETNLFHNNHHNNSNFSNPDVYQIGGVLSSEESLANFTSIIQVGWSFFYIQKYAHSLQSLNFHSNF